MAKVEVKEMLSKLSSLKKEYIVGFLLFLIITIIWVWGFNTSYFYNPDACGYAQMGREISNGNGFSTLQIFPRQVPFFQKKGYLEKENWPNLYLYPLPTIIDAFFYKITRDAIKAGVLQTGIFYLLSIPIFFILAIKLTNLNAAIVSTIFYAAHPLVFFSSYNGMSESSATFFLLAVFLTAFSGKLGTGRCLALGALCGLAYLARSQYFMLFPLVALFIWISEKGKSKFRSIIFLSVGSLIIVGPWFIRNTVVVGKPIFSFFNSRRLVLRALPQHSDLGLQLEAPVDNIEVFQKYGLAVTKKVLNNISAIVRLGFWAKCFGPHGILLLFLFASFIYRRNSRNKNYSIFRDGTVILILCNFLVASLVFHKPRFYVSLQPLIYLVCINEIIMLFNDFTFKHSQKLKIAVICGLVLFGSVRFYKVTMRHKNRPPSIRPAQNKSYEFIKKIASKNTIIVSYNSHKISLQVGCRTIKLPVFPADLLKINDRYLPIDYIVIPKKPSQEYGKFVKSDEFLRKFGLMKVLPEGSFLFERVP